MSELLTAVGHWRVAVWNDEPSAVYESEHCLASAVEPPRGDPLCPRRLVIELYRPLGGRNARALIGGQARTSESLELKVCQSRPIPLGAAASCRSRLGRNLVPGLPPEFASSSLAGLIRGASGAGPGLFIVDRGAYDEVDSSPRCFESATTLLARLLQIPRGDSYPPSLFEEELSDSGDHHQ